MLAHPLRSHAAKHPASDLVMVEGELEPAADGERLLIAPMHTHLSDDELFYVLAGSIGFRCGDDEFIAVAGDAVLIPRGHAHTWWNSSAEPARYLIAMPRRIDELINRIHEQPRTWPEMKALFAEYDAELYDT